MQTTSIRMFLSSVEFAAGSLLTRVTLPTGLPITDEMSEPSRRFDFSVFLAKIPLKMMSFMGVKRSMSLTFSVILRTSCWFRLRRDAMRFGHNSATFCKNKQ